MFWIAALLFVHQALAAYNTGAGIVPGKLNVHLVAHTHDDVGWLRTVDQYYDESVRTILTSVITSLLQNPDRKFVWVEQAFFQKWWSEQTASTQSAVKQLVKSGQLDFVNGGWCMHDEATTHYIDMIEQTTLGHAYLKQQFGKVPRIGWQLDPFGHSAVQAYLLGSEVGFDGVFFSRIDYQEKEQRSINKSLEVIWQGSRTLGSSAQIFADAFPYHYNPPEGFDYESDSAIDWQDDPSKGNVNIKERVDAFVEAAEDYATKTRTNHVMWAMGDDFKYQDAAAWFTNMDKFVHYVNKDGRVNTLYSTPSIYLDAKHAANETWELKTGDFFPYADNSESYWTGYYSSRTALKRYVRSASNYLQTARQLEFLYGRSAKGLNTDGLWHALSVLQHHDAVSGTEQQHVADDYAKQLAAGLFEASNVMNLALSCLASGTSGCNATEVSPNFVQCALLNVSYCPITEAQISNEKPLVVTVYNALGWPRREHIQIPITSPMVVVTDGSGKVIASQFTPISDATKKLRNVYVKASTGETPSPGQKYWLVFEVNVPPLGVNSYMVKPATANTTGAAVGSTITKTSQAFSLGSNTKFWFSGSSGQLTKVSWNNSKAIELLQSHNWYAAGQNSGAYILRPASEIPRALQTSGTSEVIHGPVFDAVRKQISSWIYQETRVYKGKGSAEVEFTVGPIPVDDAFGKDVITRFSTSIRNSDTFYTDSNGRDFIKRVRNSRPDWKLEVVQPVAGNYYPLNLGIYLRDGENDFSLLVDRATGGGSISEGALELMLHRRLLTDDARGVSEALNEQVCVDGTCEGLTTRGVFHLSAQPVEAAARWRRQQGQKIFSPLQLFFSTEAKMLTYSMVKRGYSLPDNVALLTFQELPNRNVLLRLAHLFEAEEDAQLSLPATVDLKQLLGNWEIQAVSELSLSANQLKSDLKPLQWRVATQTAGSKVQRGKAIDPKKLLVELAPMEIRTLELNKVASS